MDAYDISHKILKYWMALVPKNSGEINKSKNEIKVVIMTPEGYREVRSVRITEDKIELIMDNE
jgi:hypothetical protein